MGERRRYLLAGGCGVLLVLTVALALPGATTAQGEAWYGEYFATMHLVGEPALVRNDAAIDFRWGEAAPDPELPADGFAVRWSRYVDFEQDTYSFYTTTDDGVRLYVDDLPVINDWKEHVEITRSATVELTAGQHAVRMEMFDSKGNAAAQLRWEKAGAASGPSTVTPEADQTRMAETPVAASPTTPTPSPAIAGAADITADGQIYTVRRGDTLQQIAERFGVTLEALLDANPLARPDRLFIGQRLRIPAATAGAATTPTVSPADTGSPQFGATPTPPGATPGESGMLTPVPTRTPPGAGLPEASATPVAEATSTPAARGGGRTVHIFLVREGTGNIGCGDEIVGVRREIPRTAGPLRSTLELLLSEKQERYDDSGLYNALHQSDLQVERLSRRGNVWTIQLSGTLTLGGACDNPRVLEQLRQTAMQFATVRDVRFLLNGVELEKELGGH